jgi:hypothetical protein
MAKNSITDYSKTAASNTDIQSVDIDEGCLPSGINNAIRELMTDLAEMNDGTVTLTSPAVGSIGVTGNITVGGTVDGRDVATDGTKLDGVEASADVTDTANVTSAGAAMLTGATFTGSITAPDATFNGTTAVKLPAGTGAQRPTGVNGMLRYNSDDAQFEGYVDGAWGAIADGRETSFLLYSYTATSGQTTFTGSDDNSATLSYTASNIIVTLNGITLENGTDYTASNGTSIVLTVGAAAGDELNVIAFKSFTVSDTVAASTGGTFSGNVAVNGTLDVNGNELILDADGDTSITADTDDQIDFKTGGSDRMTIDSSGNTGLGVVPPSTYWGTGNNVGLFTGLGFLGSNGNYAVSLYSNGYRNSSSGFTYLDINGNTSTASGIDLEPNGLIKFRNGTASGTVLPENMRLETDGDLHVDGNVVAYSTTISDIRLKKDIAPIENAVTKVQQLNGCTFTYLKDGRQSAGLLAQDLEKVLPSAVIEDEAVFHGEEGETYKTVQYDQVIGLLVEAVKELKAEIEELKDASSK